MKDAPSSGDTETFPLAWLKMPGSVWEAVGAVTLPGRPTTLGEARGGLLMIAADAASARWLATWAERKSEERSVLLRLPGGWFELSDTTLGSMASPVAGPGLAGPGAGTRYLLRFNRRAAVQGPSE